MKTVVDMQIDFTPRRQDAKKKSHTKMHGVGHAAFGANPRALGAPFGFHWRIAPRTAPLASWCLGVEFLSNALPVERPTLTPGPSPFLRKGEGSWWVTT
jgi:hypothetical protein